MATVNFQHREILCKIVYYGPGLCGKTTNLQTIHSKVPDKIRGNLTSIATRQDRTLFFDLLPIEIGKVRDFIIRLQLYTVPGQVYYNASRKIVLKGVDGIVFVADSQFGKMEENIESLHNLRDNLTENGVDPSTVPVVLQYNKRDLSPVYTVEELNSALNPNNLSYYGAIATTGQGVFNTLKGISAIVIKDIKAELDAADTREPKPTPPPPPIETPKKLIDKVESKPVITTLPEKISEPDTSSRKQGFWDKVSSLLRKPRN